MNLNDAGQSRLQIHSRAEATTPHKLGHRRSVPVSTVSLIPTLHPVSVAHRTRQLESWLADTLAVFRNRHERQLAVIPHLVRGMKMAEFGDKYDGDIQSALRGLQKERLALDVAPLDRNAMKRKWAPAPEDENETRAEYSGKYTDSHSRTAKTREWFLVVHLSERCLRSKVNQSPHCTTISSQEATSPWKWPPPSRSRTQDAKHCTWFSSCCQAVSFMQTASHISSEPLPCQPQARVKSPGYPRILFRAQDRPQNLLPPRSPVKSAYPPPLPSSLRFPRHPRTRHAGRAETKACSASTAHL